MSPTLLLPACAAALLVVAVIRWRRAFVLSLPFLAILNGIAIPLAGSSLRADQAIACALIVPLSASILVGARRLRTDSTVWWLAGILALNVLASALHSPARAYSLMQCVNLASAWVIYVILLNFLDTREELEVFLRRALWAALAATAIGTAAFVLAVLGLPVGGAETSRMAAERLTQAYGAYGTMVEPNILGGFAAAYLILAIGLFIAPTELEDRTRIRLLKAVAMSAAVCLVLTFTRAAWLAAIAGGICVALFGRRASSIRVRPWHVIAPLAAAVAVALAILLTPGEAATLLRFKLMNLVNIGSQTAVIRLLSYTMAVQQLADHPVIGWGTFTFAPLTAQGADFQQFENWRNLWIGNYLLLALHDTGILGLGLWVGLLSSVFVRAARVVRATRFDDPIVASRAAALVGALVTLCVAFLSTSGFSLGYSWVLLGFLGAYCRVATEASEVAVLPVDFVPSGDERSAVLVE
jgi:O-antigen ligase